MCHYINFELNNDLAINLILKLNKMKKIKKLHVQNGNVLDNEQLVNVVGGMTAFATPCTIYQYFYVYVLGHPIPDFRSYVGQCIERDGVEMWVAVSNENIYVAGKCSR